MQALSHSHTHTHTHTNTPACKRRLHQLRILQRYWRKSSPMRSAVQRRRCACVCVRGCVCLCLCLCVCLCPCLCLCLCLSLSLSLSLCSRGACCCCGHTRILNCSPLHAYTHLLWRLQRAAAAGKLKQSEDEKTSRVNELSRRVLQVDQLITGVEDAVCASIAAVLGAVGGAQLQLLRCQHLYF
jgi:hypothetical protein